MAFLCFSTFLPVAMVQNLDEKTHNFARLTSLMSFPVTKHHEMAAMVTGHGSHAVIPCNCIGNATCPTSQSFFVGGKIQNHSKTNPIPPFSLDFPKNNFQRISPICPSLLKSFPYPQGTGGLRLCPPGQEAFENSRCDHLGESPKKKQF